MSAQNSALVIRSVAPTITTVSVPFLRFNRIKFGGRATVVKLSSGNLAVFSPVALEQEVQDTLQAMGGRVSYLIAPDLEHHLHLAAYKRAFPAALVIAPHGLREKRANQAADDVPVDFELSRDNKATVTLPDEFTRDCEIELFDGHPNREIALLHRPSRTLIQADLVFNLPAREQFSRSGLDPASGLLTRLATYITNIRPESKGQQRFLWWVFLIALDSVVELSERRSGARRGRAD